MKYAYSYSRLNTYRQCPLMFKRQVIEKKPVIQTEPMLVGSCFHDYIDKLTKNIINNGEYEENIWHELTHQKGEPYSDEVIAKSQELWNTYRKRFFDNLNPNIIVNTEQKFTIDSDFSSDDWFSKKAFFRGIFDRIDIDSNDNSIKIIDYKTGNKKNADSFQGQVYAWLLSKVHDLSVYDNIIVIFEHVNYKAEYYSVNYSDLPVIEQRIFETISEIENDENFYPKQNPMCSYCSYIDECSYMQYALKETEKSFEVTNMETARKVAELIQLVSAWEKKAKEKLKHFHKETGENIQLEHGEYKTVASKSKVIDTEQFYNRVVENSYNPFELLNVDKAKIDYKKYSHIKEVIEDLISYKESESFRYVKY